MAAEAGTRFGPYEIRSLLGAGGMGEVYVARDHRLDRDVALKLLPKELAADADRLRRFELEARSASSLNHPAIPAIYDVGDADGQPYFSMELVRGQTLRALLQGGAVPPRRALHITAQLADGLARAHDAGIVHRDLKPENLMVADDGFAKILDFGLAKLAAAGGETSATRTTQATLPGLVLGTHGYMSPEQASGQTSDARSDQFSFGLVLYELLTGTHAFDRPTVAERTSAIIRDEPTPIEQRNRAVPAPVRWIVERCLAKQPAERYAATRDLALDLASARDHLSELLAAPADATLPTRSARGYREPIAWALAAVLAIVSGVLAMRPTGRPPSVALAAVRFAVSAPDDYTFGAGIASSPFALSPDGRQMAFIADSSSDRRQLWVRAFDALESRAIAGTDGAINPFWSADGRSIAFFAGGRLKRVPVSGGDIVTICEARVGGGGTWSREGTILFGDGLDGPLKQVSAAGGTPADVTEVDSAQGDSAHLHPTFHSDGRHFVFTVLNGARGGTYLGSLGSRDIRKLADGTVAAQFIAPDRLAILMRDGHLMAHDLDVGRGAFTGSPVAIAEGVDVNGPNSSFSAAPSGTLVYWSGSENITQLTWMTRDGKLGETLGPPSTYVNLAIAPDGAHVAVDRFTPTPAIWMLDAARGTPARETAGEAIYQSTPVWSPDGREIVFAQAVDTPPNVYRKRVGGLDEGQRVIRNVYQSFPQSWSPDGGSVAYITIDPKTASDIWLVPMVGDAKPTPLIRTQFVEQNARISPDGRWLAYASNESGKFEIYVVQFPTVGGRKQVSTDGGSFPIWRRDGRELYYIVRGGTLMAAAMPVTADGQMSPGRPAPLFKAPTFVVGPGSGSVYDVAPDGRFLFNVFQRRTSPPATVVLNWRGGDEPTTP